MRVFEVRASSSSPSFHFFRGLHCRASPWRKSRTHSLIQLIWCPGNRSAYASECAKNHCIQLLQAIMKAGNVQWITYHYAEVISLLCGTAYTTIHRCYYSAPARERSTAISLSLCLSVCLEPLDRSSRNWADPLWPWLGPPLAVLRYVMHGRRSHRS